MYSTYRVIWQAGAGDINEHLVVKINNATTNYDFFKIEGYCTPQLTDFIVNHIDKATVKISQHGQIAKQQIDFVFVGPERPNISINLERHTGTIYSHGWIS